MPLSSTIVYHWFIKQKLMGAKVVARKRDGEEVSLETPEFAALEAVAQLLSPKELGVLAKRLANTTDPAEVARIKEQLTRGFYGI